MKTTFKQHIGIFENSMPQEFCDEVIELFEKNLDTSIGRQEEGLKKQLLYSSIAERKDLSNELGILDKELGEKFVSKCIHPLWKIYRNKYEILQDSTFRNFSIHSTKLQKTGLGEGYHTWHCEHGAAFAKERFAAYTFYLNDVEEGGETEFLYQNYRIPPKAGTMCFFPASYTHTHRGNPPLSNVKYIITGWLVLPDIKLPNFEK